MRFWIPLVEHFGKPVLEAMKHMLDSKSSFVVSSRPEPNIFLI